MRTGNNEQLPLTFSNCILPSEINSHSTLIILFPIKIHRSTCNQLLIHDYKLTQGLGAGNYGNMQVSLSHGGIDNGCSIMHQRQLIRNMHDQGFIQQHSRLKHRPSPPKKKKKIIIIIIYIYNVCD